MRNFFHILGVLCALSCTSILSAATFVITNGNNAGAGSFREAVTLANDYDILVFSPNVDTVKLLGAIVLNKSLTVTTTTGYEVCLTPQTTPVRLMQVTTGKCVILENIHFYNVNMLNSGNPLQGLGMTNSGYTTLNNCQFKSLWSGANGAAMFSTINSSVKMNNCAFIDNRSDYGNGPAMVNAGIVTAKNCLFMGNRTEWGEGGALQGLFSGVFRLYQCEFVNNYGMMGGAIMTQNTSVLHSHGCVYTGNRSASDGGAIFNGNTTYSYGDIFENDSAEYSGGAIANYSALYIVSQGDSNAVFHSNYATDRGGAIVNYGSMTVTGTFGSTGNVLPIQFGGVPSFATGAAIFNKGNKAHSGGAIGNRPGASCVLTGNILIQNNLADTLSGKGGAIYSDSLCVLSIQNGVVIKKNKSYAGGGIFNYFGSVTLNQIKLRENFAKFTGGGFQSEVGANGGALSLQNVEIAANKLTSIGATSVAGRSGAGVYLNGGAGTFNNVTLENNIAQFGAGAGVFAKAGNFTFTNCTFFGNSALGIGATGGAIKTANTALAALNLVLNNCTIALNTATTEGGGLHTSNYVFLNNSIVTGNSNYDLVGYFNSTLGHNIWNTRKTGAGSGLVGSTAGNITNKTYQQVFGGLYPAYNGSFTQSIALPVGSVAINAGVPMPNLSFDQRGKVRDLLPDVGAVELYVNIPTTPNSVSVATTVYEGADGWKHYYNSNGELLLSLNFHGQAVGNIVGANPGMIVKVGLTDEVGSGMGQDLTNADYVALPANGWFSMNRYWKVDVASQPTDSVSVRFYYNQTDYNDVANIANGFLPNTVVNDYSLRFFKVDGANQPLGLNVPASAFHLYEHGAAPSLNAWKKGELMNFSYAEFYVSSFSGGSGGASSNGGPLPVEWTKFDLHLAGERAVKLNWVTGAEVGNDKFVVERSEDGKNFQAIGEVAAAGYSDGQTQYDYLDENLNYRKYYYRVKQLDIDGKFTYTETKFIMTSGETLAYPNPTRGDLFISAGIERQSMDISDAAGHVVKHYKNVPSQINISDLVPGVYYLRVGTEYQTIVKE